MSAEKANCIIQSIKAVVGEKVVAQSSVGDGLAEKLEAGLAGRRWNTVLEIGTLRGLSACVLACFAENVITIDCDPHEDREKVFKAAGKDISNRISSVIIPDNDAKVILVRHLVFDGAFIDAGHTEGQVALDFSLAKRCGELLFHDYPKSGSGCNGVGLVLDGATAAGDGVVTVCEPLAWWRAK